ncbi:MAG: hypothetical protein CVU46_02765 [Chloroflexi bacterium HGW-Chloroflexi-8]|jgi:hypothetical protein|nr:MAG: hypothetical protein CVU46_02765 [Chloroflexi bacterium HGW-Chloroflexi-8]
MKFLPNFSRARIFSTILISLVCVVNIQAGLDFYFRPELYTSGYELIGMPGQIAISGFGILFIMWNIPYIYALWNPIKNKAFLVQAIWMQFIGCFGETTLLFRLPENSYLQLRSSILRFVIFDSIGLLLLILSFLIIRNRKNFQK